MGLRSHGWGAGCGTQESWVGDRVWDSVVMGRGQVWNSGVMGGGQGVGLNGHG